MNGYMIAYKAHFHKSEHVGVWAHGEGKACDGLRCRGDTPPGEE
jgi:hypothetical protein